MAFLLRLKQDTVNTAATTIDFIGDPSAGDPYILTSGGLQIQPPKMREVWGETVTANGKLLTNIIYENRKIIIQFSLVGETRNDIANSISKLEGVLADARRYQTSQGDEGLRTTIEIQTDGEDNPIFFEVQHGTFSYPSKYFSIDTVHTQIDGYYRTQGCKLELVTRPFAYIDPTVNDSELAYLTLSNGDLFDNTISGTEYSELGFESGDTSEADATVTGGYFSITEDAAHNSVYGLQTDVDGSVSTADGYLERTSNFSSDTGVYINLWLNFENMNMAAGDSFYAVQSQDGSAEPFRLRVTNNGGVYELQLVYATDTVAINVLDGMVEVNDTTGWHNIQISWKASTGAGNDDGFVAWFQDFNLLGDVSGLDTDTFAVDGMRYGVFDLDVGSNGTFYMDNIKEYNTYQIFRDNTLLYISLEAASPEYTCEPYVGLSDAIEIKKENIIGDQSMPIILTLRDESPVSGTTWDEISRLYVFNKLDDYYNFRVAGANYVISSTTESKVLTCNLYSDEAVFPPEPDQLKGPYQVFIRATPANGKFPSGVEFKFAIEDNADVLFEGDWVASEGDTGVLNLGYVNGPIGVPANIPNARTLLKGTLYARLSTAGSETVYVDYFDFRSISGGYRILEASTLARKTSCSVSSGDDEQFVDQSGSITSSYGDLAGLVNGSNALFTVSESAYISSTLEVYLNGQLQVQGTGEDWVETTPASGTFTFNTAPQASDQIMVIYQTTSTGYVDQSGGTADTYGAVAGTINGVNTIFTVHQGDYLAGTLKVWLNGQLQTQGTGESYTETNPSSGTFTFNTAPISGDEITASYQTTRTFQIAQSGGTGASYGVVSGAINGVNDLFSVAGNLYNSGTLIIWLNGQLQTQGATKDWVEDSPTAGTFQFNNPPESGDEITVVYLGTTTQAQIIDDNWSVNGAYLQSPISPTNSFAYNVLALMPRLLLDPNSDNLISFIVEDDTNKLHDTRNVLSVQIQGAPTTLGAY